MSVKHDEKFERAKKICLTYFAKEKFALVKPDPEAEEKRANEGLDRILKCVKNGTIDLKIEYAMEVMEDFLERDNRRIDELEEAIIASGRSEEKIFKVSLERLRRGAKSAADNTALAFDPARRAEWEKYFSKEIGRVEEALLAPEQKGVSSPEM